MTDFKSLYHPNQGIEAPGMELSRKHRNHGVRWQSRRRRKWAIPNEIVVWHVYCILTDRRSETWEVRSSPRRRAKDEAGQQQGIGKLSAQLI